MDLQDILDTLGADDWEVSPIGDLICPCGNNVELDGTCPEGCESPLLQHGVI